MCGIAGILSHDPNVLLRSKAAIGLLQHRGPDGHGWTNMDPCALAHTRLAIIDLSDAGSQPFLSVDGRYSFVFNGEIYNYKEMRDGLEQAGHTFRTRTDTEVLLTAVTSLGMDQALERANGMFAFALWDRQQQTLTLSRDRLGKKPLYWTIDDGGGTFAFASELKALSALRTNRLTMDASAVNEYLRRGCVGACRSIYQEARKLPPATYMRVYRTSGDASWAVSSPVRYWSARLDQCESAPDDREEFDALLRDAVKIRLRSDVSVGAFLSGGFDSALVCGLAGPAQLSETITAEFFNTPYDESMLARSTAAHFGLVNSSVRVEPPRQADLDALAYIFDEPIADDSAYALWVISKASRSKVMLSGDGGDELLGGYERYPKFLHESAVRRWISKAPGSRSLAGFMPTGIKGSRTARRLVARRSCAYYEMGSTFDRAELLEVRPGSTDLPEDILNPYHRLDDLVEIAPADLQVIDSETYLPDQILVKADRSTMAAGVELRSPLLDYRLFDFVFGRRQSFARGRQILVERFTNMLPPHVVGKKRGFTPPLCQWVQAQDNVEERLIEERFLSACHLSRSGVRRVLQQYRSGYTDNARKIWTLLILHAWWRRWIVQGASS